MYIQAIWDWKIVIIAHTSPNNNFLYNHYMYFTLLNPNMSFNLNEMFVFGNSISIR